MAPLVSVCISIMDNSSIRTASTHTLASPEEVCNNIHTAPHSHTLSPISLPGVCVNKLCVGACVVTLLKPSHGLTSLSPAVITTDRKAINHEQGPLFSVTVLS